MILTKDNSMYGGKRSIEIDKSILERELKEHFGWRTPTKFYNSMKDRYFGLGSVKFDGFINYMIDKGY